MHTESLKILTWREMKKEIDSMPEEWKDFPISVHVMDSDEYFDIECLKYTEEDDVLSAGEPYLETKQYE